MSLEMFVTWIVVWPLTAQDLAIAHAPEHARVGR